MHYALDFKPEAKRDLRRMSPEIARRVLKKIEAMCEDLAGDIKKLIRYAPGWRLRVGDWRVLFEIVGTTIVIYNVVHRSEAYE